MSHEPRFQPPPPSEREWFPGLVLWEITRECHPDRRQCHPSPPERGELAPPEARRLLREIREMGTTRVVLTGGDPLLRPDVVALVRLGRELGLEVTLTPSVTPRLHDEVLRSLRLAGLARLALRLDSPQASIHDGLCGVPGNFEYTLERIETARSMGHSLQVDTTVTSRTVHHLEALGALLGDLEVDVWNLLFPIQERCPAMGRMLDPRETEEAFTTIHRVAKQAAFRVQTAEAPHYRRFALQAGDTEAGSSDGEVSDGNGMLFVDHVGEVYPSGSLPVSGGNVRQRPLAEIYRMSVVFQALRSPDLLGGKCGECEFRKLCGGSRARAYALTGDWLAEEPRCGRTRKSPR